MNRQTMSKVVRTALFTLSILAGTQCFAWHGGGGGWHGGGGGWHGGGGGWHSGGGDWHGGGWHGGGWHGGGWNGGWGGAGVVVGVPFGEYYAPACQNYRVCNRYGHCWLEPSC